MLGAIFGDIVGSHYEFDPTKNYDFQLLHEDSRPTDDTVMTLAVAKALMDTYGKDDDTIRRAVVKEMQRLGRKYHNAGYGGTFYHWLDNPEPKPYNSYGNGSGMRVSAVGWLYPSLGQTLNMAKLTADVTHNHPEGIKGAQAIAAGMYLARTGHDKDFIKEYIANTFRYDLDRTLDDIRPTYEFDVTCQGSVPEAIIAFLESDSYEDAIRKAVSLGGDADTQGCMAGALAEAFYGDVPQPFRQEALERLPKDLREIAERFEEFRKDLCKASGVHWIDGGHELIDGVPQLLHLRLERTPPAEPAHHLQEQLHERLPLYAGTAPGHRPGTPGPHHRPHGVPQVTEQPGALLPADALFELLIPFVQQNVELPDICHFLFRIVPTFDVGQQHLRSFLNVLLMSVHLLAQSALVRPILPYLHVPEALRTSGVLLLFFDHANTSYTKLWH